MAESKKTRTGFKVLTLLRTYAEGIVLTVLLALVLRQFVFTPYMIPNNLMAPNLVTGDFIMAYKLPYGIKVPLISKKFGQKSPQRGDLVIFQCPDSPSEQCLRRVVGLPGDRIEIRGERLFVNGEQADYRFLEENAVGFVLEEKFEDLSYRIQITGDGERDSFGPVIVGPQSIFLLSDHRGLGSDSREWGGVPYYNVHARASLVWFSVDWPRELDTESNAYSIRWDRLFHSPR